MWHPASYASRLPIRIMKNAMKVTARLLGIGIATLFLSLASWTSWNSAWLWNIAGPGSIVVFLFWALGGKLLAISAIPLAFLLWSRQLLRNDERIPVRSFFLFGGIVLASLVWFSAGWEYGLQYQRFPRLMQYVGTNIGFAVLLCLLAFCCRRHMSWWASLIFHWLLFVWIVWTAFPWLGERV